MCSPARSNSVEWTWTMSGLPVAAATARPAGEVSPSGAWVTADCPPDRKSTRLESSYPVISYSVFFFNDTATTEIYTLSLRDALPISHGTVHAAAFDVVDPLVDVLAGAVELGGVDVDDERLAGGGGDGQAGGEGEPVVGVDDVELLA